MMHVAPFRRPNGNLRTFALSAVFLAFAGGLLVRHATLIRSVRETGLPAAVAIPDLEKRLKVLREQVEVSEVQRALAEGSQEEMVAQFVLPRTTELDRVVDLLDLIGGRLKRSAVLRGMSALAVGEDRPLEDPEGIRAVPLSFTADMTEDGLSAFLSIIDLSGLVSVADALTRDEIHALLRVTEEENPASVASIEHFLSTPLLAYARESKSYEEQVLRSFASPAFEQTFSRLLRDSSLKDARERLGGEFGTILSDAKQWPMRFLTVDRIRLEPKGEGWMKTEVEMSAYSKEGK